MIEDSAPGFNVIDGSPAISMARVSATIDGTGFALQLCSAVVSASHCRAAANGSASIAETWSHRGRVAPLSRFTIKYLISR
jgi:hypothetical protein